ncbi:MAG: glycoside hydrolase family 130 protein [Phycisphaerae bacterium]|nr:glycoside hydrolase family 130 protein [Phycisphaerae bacterium]
MNSKSTAPQNIPFPWVEPRDESVIWRYEKNPVVGRHQLPFSNTIFNSGVARYGNEYVGVFRVDRRSMDRTLHLGRSANGFDWTLSEAPIDFILDHEGIVPCNRPYDPRIIQIGDRYYIIWCNTHYGPTLAMAYTDDFETFHQTEAISLPYNRNGVLFPEKINGNYALLSRPCSNGQCQDGEIFYSESPDLTHWGKFRHVMGPAFGWSGTKVGAGPAPIRTSEGWLLIYHGVRSSCNGFIYSAGVALLDLEQPWKVLARPRPFLLTPETDYECVGDVPNVVFPSGLLHDETSGRLAIYYGAADTCLATAFTTVDRLLQFAKSRVF